MDPDTKKEVEFSLSLIEQWPEPMLLLDGERFIEANPAALQLLGYRDKGELLSRTPYELSPALQPDGERSSDKARKFLAQILRGETLRFEWVHLSARGQEIYVDVTLSPIQKGEENIILCSWHEIGSLKLAEKAARLANEALLKSNNELMHFAQVAAHDLRTPLRTISAFTQLLHQEVLNQLNEQARQWSSLVMDGSRRMQALIDDLLSYSRVDASPCSYGPVDSRRIFEEAKANLQRLIQESGAEVSSGELPRVLGDGVQLLQVMQNLIENGIKYNTSKPPRVNLSANRNGNTWEFSVADNGIGIEPIHHDRVFEMFSRLHTQQEYAGTGIGLAICQRAIERHGGRIWVECSPQGGSVFHFTLPAADPMGHGDRCRTSPREKFSGNVAEKA